ncbi:hypothetical protein GCM10027053_06070 [Intrasporangium mesophilum]
MLVAGVPAEASPGDLDPTFGGHGLVVTDFGGEEGASAVAIQADGKIVVVGEADGDFVVVRYLPDGAFDTSFGVGGRQVTDFGGMDVATAVAIQGDGRIVVAGGTHGPPTPTNPAPAWDFALERLNADGSLDTGFSGDARQTTDFGADDRANALALQGDGRIVLGGGSGSDFALARFNPDGSLDSSFSGDGRQTADFGGQDSVAGVVAQGDGNLVAGGSTSYGQTDEFALARFRPDGSLDSSYGIGGRQTTDFGGEASAGGVAIQADGRVIIAGGVVLPSSPDTRLSDFALARYDVNGSLDTSFGFGGKQTSDLDVEDYGNAVALGADGKIVVVGQSMRDFTLGGFCFGIAMFNPDGSPDLTFSGDGKQITSFGGASDVARAVAVQADGRTLVAGFTSTPGFTNDIALARYQSPFGPVDTSPPETFITGGPSGTVTATAATFSFSSSEPGSTFRCRVDGSAFVGCSSPNTTPTLTPGPHTFEVKATDAWGNTDPSPAVWTWTIAPADTSPPETFITGGPSGSVTATAATFTFTSSEPGSTFRCRLDGAAFTSCGSPYTTANLARGPHTFEVTATDASGNIDPTPASRSWTVVLDYRAAVLGTPGLVSYWRLDDTSGTTAADATGANAGLYYNGVALGQPGALLGDPNSSAGFDGSNDYVAVADGASLDTGDSLTLEAWVRRASTSNSARTVLSKGSGSWRLSFVKDTLTFSKGGSGMIAAASVPTKDTTSFHHLVATKSGHLVTLYIDGIDRTGQVTSRAVGNNATALNIGRDTDGTQYFAGLIDEVAIYNVALSSAQVQQHFTASGR